MKAQEKLTIINTTLVEANCQHNADIREIFIKYVSHLRREVDIEYLYRNMHTRATSLIDLACGWYFMNISHTYKGKNIGFIFEDRHQLTVKYYRI